MGARITPSYQTLGFSMDPGSFGLTASPRIAVTYEESLPGDGEA